MLVGDDEPNGRAGDRGVRAGARRGRELAVAGASITPLERRVVEVFAGAAEIESDLLAELEALPRPSADDEAIKRRLPSSRRRT